jgi:hypothetical protein
MTGAASSCRRSGFDVFDEPWSYLNSSRFPTRSSSMTMLQALVQIGQLAHALLQDIVFEFDVGEDFVSGLKVTLVPVLSLCR